MWKNEITGKDIRSTYIWNSKDPPFACGSCGAVYEFIEAEFSLPFE